MNEDKINKKKSDNSDSIKYHTESKDRLLQTLIIFIGLIVTASSNLFSDNTVHLEPSYYYVIFIFVVGAVFLYSGIADSNQFRGFMWMSYFIVSSSFTFILLSFVVVKSKISADPALLLSLYFLLVAFLMITFLAKEETLPQQEQNKYVKYLSSTVGDITEKYGMSLNIILFIVGFMACILLGSYEYSFIETYQNLTVTVPETIKTVDNSTLSMSSSTYNFTNVSREVFWLIFTPFSKK